MILLCENKMSYGIENELCGLSHNLNYMNTHTHIRTKKGTMGQFGPMVLKYNKDFIMQYLNHKKEPSLKGSKGNNYV